MNLFISPDALATNPTKAVLGFRRQMVYHLHIWALIAVAPLIVIQWQQHHILLSGMLTLFCANAILVIAFLRFRGTYFLHGRLFPMLAVICATYSTYINGYVGLYWAYPASIALFFLLPLRQAIVFSVIFVAAMALVSSLKFAVADFWRICFSLGLSCLFAMTFAWLVGKLQRELTRLATTDPLTGCLNRSQMADVMNHHITLRERYERVSSLVLIDLDYFKSINDKWGHLAGDRVLKEMALRLHARLRDTDRLFRIGGEEFMLVLPETRQKDADRLAHQLLETISARPFLDDLRVTASASVAEVEPGDTWSSWLNRADQALYEAKSAGRDQVVNVPRQPAMAKTPQFP